MLVSWDVCCWLSKVWCQSIEGGGEEGVGWFGEAHDGDGVQGSGKGGGVGGGGGGSGGCEGGEEGGCPAGTCGGMRGTGYAYQWFQVARGAPAHVKCASAQLSKSGEVIMGSGRCVQEGFDLCGKSETSDTLRCAG